MEWSQRIAPWMFAASLTFLVFLAVLVVVWVDVPAFREEALNLGGSSGADVQTSETLQRLASMATIAMALLWPIFIAESVYHLATRPWDRGHARFHFFSLTHALFPPLRLASRIVEMHRMIWLPVLGWFRPEPRIRRRLERAFSKPMIGIALLILPVLLLEFVFRDAVAEHRWLRALMHVAAGVIWFAFAAEFILMISIAQSKVQYIKRHWIDLVIVLLPLFSFLRMMQVVRTTKLARMANMSKLTKLTKAYRLRGTLLKTTRALVLLNVVNRYLERDPENRMAKLRQKLRNHEKDARLIRLEIARLQRQRLTPEAGDESTGRTEADGGDTGHTAAD